MIYKGNPTIMLWNQSETDTPRREKFGRCHAAARAHPPRPVRPPRSGRAQSKRHLSSRNDRFIAREAIYKGISFINQCKYCVFCENPAKLFIASRHSYRGGRWRLRCMFQLRRHLLGRGGKVAPQSPLEESATTSARWHGNDQLLILCERFARVRMPTQAH